MKEPSEGRGAILVAYTTEYREGGAELARVARTLADEKRACHRDVHLARVESKRAFVDAIREAERDGGIRELHFVGHSGMYGPMFGTRAMPEQLSPHEWRTLPIAFTSDGEAFFHACRTARWFAPFFARTHGVPASGYYWYTTFSAAPDRFARPSLAGRDGKLYAVGCPGLKSHGLGGSLAKYTGRVALEPMKRFEPRAIDEAGSYDAGSYDAVAELYAEAFEDIRVRREEWRWLERHLPRGPIDVLDIGCGNGALLDALGDRLRSGVGVDVSRRMIELARRRASAKLSFERVDGPTLPLSNASADVVISFLSFRYLDWDPILLEIVRVLRPGGRLLVIDMVEKPLSARELGAFARSKLRNLRHRRAHPEFARRLARLVEDPGWARMLEHNPIRSDHELRWYLESRFPGRSVELLDVGYKSRVVAFDSGPITAGYIAPQSYP